MAGSILDICLDTTQPNRTRLVYGVQNDYGARFLNVRFTANGKGIDIAPTASVSINALRADGERKAFIGEVNEDGTARVPVAQWFLDVPGEVIASVAAVTDESRLTTQEFYIVAKESVWDGITASKEESPDKDVLSAIVSSEAERKAAEAERIRAEAARATAEADRIRNEQERIRAEAARATAEAARAETEAERVETTEAAEEAAMRATEAAEEAERIISQYSDIEELLATKADKTELETLRQEIMDGLGEISALLGEVA